MTVTTTERHVGASGARAAETERGSSSGSSKPARSRVVDARSTNLVSALVVGSAVAVYLTYAVATGLPVGAALRGLLMIGVTQVLPGALVWRAVRPRDGWLLEDLAAGFAIGIALSVPTQIVAGLTHQRWLAVALPLLVVAVVLLVPVTRHRARQARWSPIAWWFAPSLGFLSLAALPQFMAFAANNRIVYTTPTAPYIDTYLHQALASQLLTRGPDSWPTVAGESLGYHWFTHAWIAQVSASSGIELDEVLLRLMPALMPMAVVLAVAVAGLRLGRRASTGVVAAAITMVGGRFNPFGVPELGPATMPTSPTLALGAPTLVLLVTVLALRWRHETLRGAYVLVPVLAVVAAGTKGSTSPLVVAGLGLAVVAMLIWNRRLLLPVVSDLVTVAAGLGVALVFVFKESSAGLALGISGAANQTVLADTLGRLPTRWLVLLAVVITVVGGLSRAAAAFALPFFADRRRDPLSWVLIGASVAGAVATGLFSHPGRSQNYFYLSAIPLAALGSALGLARLRERFGDRVLGPVVTLALAGGFLSQFGPGLAFGPLGPKAFDRAWPMAGSALACVLVLACVGFAVGRRRRGLATSGTAALLALLFAGGWGFVHAFDPRVATTSQPVSLSSWGAVSQGQIDAARFIRDHSNVTDLVMTNRHCTVPRVPYDGCDSRRWIVTAFSERQALVEGWTATPRATQIAPKGRDSVTVDYWKPDVLKLNDGFTTLPTADAQRRLWNLGVRWVYVENTIAHAATLAPYATLRFSTADASAWQLNAPGR